MRKREEQAEEGLAGDPQEKALVIGAVPTGGYNAAGQTGGMHYRLRKYAISGAFLT